MSIPAGAALIPFKLTFSFSNSPNTLHHHHHHFLLSRLPPPPPLLVPRLLPPPAFGYARGALGDFVTSYFPLNRYYYRAGVVFFFYFHSLLDPPTPTQTIRSFDGGQQAQFYDHHPDGLPPPLGLGLHTYIKLRQSNPPPSAHLPQAPRVLPTFFCLALASASSISAFGFPPQTISNRY